MAKYRYAIIDRQTVPVSIVYSCDDLEQCKKKCDDLRRDRFANGNRVKEIIFDNSPFDNFYNVVKISDSIY